MESEIELLSIKKQLQMDAIVAKTSRMIKDNDQPSISGMTEVATRWLTELDQLLFELGNIENAIADYDIK